MRSRSIIVFALVLAVQTLVTPVQAQPLCTSGAQFWTSDLPAMYVGQPAQFQVRVLNCTPDMNMTFTTRVDVSGEAQLDIVATHFSGKLTSCADDHYCQEWVVDVPAGQYQDVFFDISPTTAGSMRIEFLPLPRVRMGEEENPFNIEPSLIEVIIGRSQSATP